MGANSPERAHRATVGAPRWVESRRSAFPLRRCAVHAPNVPVGLSAASFLPADEDLLVAAALACPGCLSGEVAWQLENGRDARHASSVAKLVGATAANKVVDRVLQIHGGMGYSKEMPIERWYRELRLSRIYEGTDEILRRTIARNLIKGHVKVGHLGD